MAGLRVVAFAAALGAVVSFSAKGQEIAAAAAAANLAPLVTEAFAQDPGTQGPPTENPNPIENRRDRIYYPGDTESARPLAIKLFGNILLDQKDIWTSPFRRMNRRNAKWWILFGGLTAGLVASDHYLEGRLGHSAEQSTWGNGISQVGADYTVIPITAAFYLTGVFADNRMARETGVLGAEALLDALIVSTVIKTAVRRDRPYAKKEPAEFFESGDSFPSGHAIESWSLASVVASEYHSYKWVPFVAYGLAGLVSAARYIGDRHYPSDIVAGAAMGWFIGRYVYRTHIDIGIHKHPAALMPRIIPQLQPSSGTYAVALAWTR